MEGLASGWVWFAPLPAIERKPISMLELRMIEAPPAKFEFSNMGALSDAAACSQVTERPVPSTETLSGTSRVEEMTIGLALAHGGSATAPPLVEVALIAA